jgi:adenosylcobinamide kinase/adenosylcobinamide-phosphate guanylyltransferase
MESINKEDKVWFIKMNSLINLLKKRKSKTFIVGEQVGWSLVSEYKIGNTYIERIGELQKSITKISKDNWLAINGRAIKIDEISLEIPS